MLIEKELARIERLASARAAIAAVEAAGGTAHYHCVDLTDAAAVTAVVDRIAGDHRPRRPGAPRRGAGDQPQPPRKEPREFDLVFDVKSDGWFALWHALAGLDVGAAVVFSSVAGRFGNTGQTDYAAANDLLCKVVSGLRRTRPGTRGLALDWTAWGGIGMATRGSIPRIMEMAGVQMLPPEAGVAWIRRELASSGFRGEVVVAGRLGAMAAEYADHGGLDSARMADAAAFGPMVGQVTASAHHGLVVTTTLDPAEQPFLDDHRIDGTPVLPGVMGMEAFAEAASLLAPAGHRVAAVEDVAFLAPVKFYRDEPRTLTVTVRAEQGPDDELLARCRLTAERRLPGQDAPQVTTHFTGTVRLSPRAAEAESREPVAGPEGRDVTGEDVYALYFHGPAYRVVAAAHAEDDTAVARMTDPLPDGHAPAGAPLSGLPRHVELCFQAAGLLEAGRHARMALPARVRSSRVLLTDAEGPVHAVAREAGDGVYDCVVVDGRGRVLVHVDGYETVPLPTAVPDDVVAPLADAFGGSAVRA